MLRSRPGRAHCHAHLLASPKQGSSGFPARHTQFARPVSSCASDRLSAGLLRSATDGQDSNKAWRLVEVCDGRKALILENVGNKKSPNLRAKEVHDHPDSSTHEQGTSPLGRSFQSIGHGRSAVSQTDWHDEAERTFLRTFAERLNSAVEAGETKAITMVAARIGNDQADLFCSA